MLLTEEQAKKKRCYRDLSSTCVGSMCMAWRQEVTEMRHPDSGRVIDTKPTDRGYCGRAGRPEL